MLFFHLTKILEIGIISLGSVAHQFLACFMQKKDKEMARKKEKLS